MGKVLITGATGFIGSHVVEYFSEHGQSVKCLVREHSDTSFLKTIGVEICIGDIVDEDSVYNALIGCDAVIHIAALAADWGKYEEFIKVNIDGTLNVLKASRERDIENIIITGSISSYGEEHCNDKKNEESPFKSHYPYFLDAIFPCKMNYYRDSKALATQQAIKYAEENNQNIHIIEPTWVFGEREFFTGFYEYLKAIKNGANLMPGSSKNKFHVIYARDLARAYYLAWEKKIEGIHRVIIGNKTTDYQEKIYNTFCKKANLKKPKRIPKWIIYPIAFFSELIATIIRKKNPPLLTRGRVNMFYDTIDYDTSKVKELLEFESEYSLERAISNTVNWYKVNGYL